MKHIGIDPGTLTGVAVSEGGRLVYVHSMALHYAMQFVRGYHTAGQVMVHFEDARLRRWFGKMDAKQARYGAAVREGAGAAKRDAAIWAEFLADLGIPHRAVKPAPGTTKLSAEAFERLTGWTARTNEHARDAAMLILGR